MLRQYRSSAEIAVRSQHTASSVSMTHRRESVGCAQLLYLSWRLRVASCAELATHAPCRLRESSPQPYAYEPHDLPAELRKHAICFSDAAACSECRLDHKHCLSGRADSPAVLGPCAALRFAPVFNALPTHELCTRLSHGAVAPTTSQAPCGDRAHDHTLLKRMLCQLS